MVSAWPEPPPAMSAEKSAGVRDGMETFALTITNTPPNYAGEEQNGVPATLEWPLQTGGSHDHTAADVKQFCADTKPGEGRVEACIKAHVADLSDACKVGLANEAAGED